MEAKRQKKDDSRERTEQQSSIQILTQDELGHIFSFIGICDRPLALRETCRLFSNEIDWGMIIRNCVLVNRKGDGYFFGDKKFPNLYKQESIRQRFIVLVLANPTLSDVLMKVLMRDILSMAINQNDTETVQLLLAEESCEVDGALHKALIRNKTEVAAILQNDPRVRRSMVMCSECNDSPGCVKCMIASFDAAECTDPDGFRKEYCRACAQGEGRLCIVCEEYECETCYYEIEDQRFYNTCSTCRNIACENKFIGYEHLNGRCFQRCKNYDTLCGNIQCFNCANDEDHDLAWYQCTAESDHVFCQECNPDMVKYDIENSQSNCPACQNKCVRRCWNSDLCRGKNERNTLEGSSVWYKCSTDSDHVFCQECNPDINKYDLDLGNDQSNCPACQKKCVRKCWNSDLCGGKKERNTLEGSSDWYKKCTTDSDHVFCQKCNPDIIEYDLALEDGQSNCPACQNKCVRKCWNYELGLWCRKERDTLEGSSDWYQCTTDKDHVFCQECNPDIIQYDLDLKNGQSNCPACQNRCVRLCGSYVLCGYIERDTLERSKNAWYKCPDNHDHMFCHNCNPDINDAAREYMIQEEGIDVEKCPVCQDYMPC